MESQIQNIPAAPQIGAPASIIQLPGVPQRTGVNKFAVTFLGQL